VDNKVSRRDWVEGVFRDHADALFRYLRSFRLSEEDTYDLVQTVFLKLLDARPASLREARAWLFTVGRNLAINALARNSRYGETSKAEDPPDKAPGALETLLADEENRRLWGLFRLLPPEEQEIFRLHCEHGLSYAEIGRVVQKATGAVKVAVHRARARLRSERAREAVQNSSPVLGGERSERWVQ